MVDLTCDDASYGSMTLTSSGSTNATTCNYVFYGTTTNAADITLECSSGNVTVSRITFADLDCGTILYNDEGECVRIWDYNFIAFEGPILPDELLIAHLPETPPRDVLFPNRVRKGEELLRDILGMAEYMAYRVRGYIDVPSPKDPDKRYRIRYNKRIGIVKREEGNWVEKPLSLCVHPQCDWDWVRGDVLATLVMLCRYNEEELEKKSNTYEWEAA